MYYSTPGVILNLFEHLPGCTPLNPCAHCAAVSLLRSKLSQEDIVNLAKKLNGIEDSDISSALQTADVLARPIDDLGLSRKTANSVRAYKLFTIRDLIKKREAILKRHLSRKELGEVKEKLAARGLALGMRAWA